MLARIARFEFTVFEMTVVAVIAGLVATLVVAIPVH